MCFFLCLAGAEFGWKSLGTAFWQHIDFGLQNAPSFNDDYTPGRYIFDITYNILVIVIMVAIITGIIIDTFADLRDTRNEVQEDMDGLCFICSLPREIFERNRVKFSDHTEQDHNAWNYLFYKMYLEQKPQTELTARERELRDQMAKQSIAYFPLQKALCLPQEDEEKELEELKEQIGTLDDQIRDLHSELGTHTQELRDGLQQLSAIVQQLAIQLAASAEANATNPAASHQYYSGPAAPAGGAPAGSPRKDPRRK